MKVKGKKSGVQMPEWLSITFGKVASVAEMQMKDAHAEASLDWIIKASARDSSSVHLASSGLPTIR